MSRSWDTARSTVATALHARRDALVSSWERLVRTEVTALGELPRDQLVAGVAALIGEAIGALVGDAIGALVGTRERDGDAVAAHVARRGAAGVAVEAVVAEYACLRRVLRDEVLALAPREALGEAIAAVEAAADRLASRALAAYLRAEDEARERLVAILAHDLRTPLSCITMAAGMLATAGGGDPRLYAPVISAAHRMQRMVHDVLDFARTQLGDVLAVARRPDDLGAICRVAIDELAIAYPDRAIELDASGDLSGCFDRDRVVRAVSNLVRNAIEHGIGDVRVRVGARADGRTLVIDVINLRAPSASGPLPIASSPRIGFGLYIVHKIAAAHGGSCTVAATNGETTYSLVWPRGGEPSPRDTRRGADASP
jgi:signal transduction histidine kinase